jgi:hypothetical protein
MPKDYDPEVGLAIDLRKMSAAYDQWDRANQASIGSGSGYWTPRKVFEWVCARAGITIERGLELEKLQKKWPEEVPDWAREEARG